MCERCFGQQTNLDRHLKKHEMDGQGGTDANCSSVLSASPEVSSSPEVSCTVNGRGPSGELMMMQQLIPTPSAQLPRISTPTDSVHSVGLNPLHLHHPAVAASYFADIRRFMGQVTAADGAKFNHNIHVESQHHHRHHHSEATGSDDELSQDSSDRGGASGGGNPVPRLEITS